MRLLGREMDSLGDYFFGGNGNRNARLRDEVRRMIADQTIPTDAPEWIKIDTGISVNSKTGKMRNYWNMGLPGF